MIIVSHTSLRVSFFGGKQRGAGSDGFLLVLVPPERQARFQEKPADVAIARIGLDTIGSTILTG